jgi:AraC-like DNA-binding protein
MDALSEAFRSIRVTSAFFFSGEFSAPWHFAGPPQPWLALPLLPGIEHVVLFHMLIEGRATARAKGHDVALVAGDVVILPHGDAHEVWNGRTDKRYPQQRILPSVAAGALATEKWGGGGPVTRLICGYFGCERYAESLFLNGLPPIIKVNLRRTEGAAWIEKAIRSAVDEHKSGRPGRLAVLARLAESLVTEALCRYMDELPPEQASWLAAARDATAGRVLACIHREPARAWTLASLANAAGTSRSVLAKRFVLLLNESPLTYLARWRLQLATRLLETTDRKALAIALEVGYESEAAFNRAFRREIGVPPARYRREHRRARSVSTEKAATSSTPQPPEVSLC